MQGTTTTQDRIETVLYLGQYYTNLMGRIVRAYLPQEGIMSTTEMTITRRALVIVDVQNDFIDGGSLAVQDAEQAAHRIATILPLGNYDQIVTTQDWHVDPGDHFSDTPDYKDTWPVHCQAGTYGAELSPRLDPILHKIDASFFKGQHAASYSGFDGIDHPSGRGYVLGRWLRNHKVTEVDIVGIAFDYCVKATALDAVKLGYKTRVLPLYTASVAASTYAQAKTELQEAGVELAEGQSK